MIYFLIATGHPPTLRPKYEQALDWFGETVPFANPSVVSRIAEDGRWFVLSVGVADGFASSRLRLGADRALAINGPALRCDGEAFGDSTIDRIFEGMEGRDTTSLFTRMSGSFSVGALNPSDGLVAFSSFDNTHPVYCTEGNGFCAVSKRSTALARLADSSPDLRQMCWLVAASNLFGPGTAFEGVSKIEAGEAVTTGIGESRLLRQRVAGSIWPSPNAPLQPDLQTADWDDLTARLVADVKSACAAGGERKVNLALTGGKDSRLVLALALAAGVVDRLRIFTRGMPSWGDSIVAAEVCRSIGAEHVLEIPKTVVDGQVRTKPWSDIQVHVSRYEGMVCPWDGPGTSTFRGQSMMFEGIGGELYRGSGGHAKQFKRVLPTTVQTMQRAFVNYHQRFDPAGLLRPPVAKEMKNWLFDWVSDTARHVRLDALPEKFFVDYRMGHWNGPLNQSIPGRTRVSALLDVAGALEFLRLPPDVRPMEKFHYEVMRRTAPSLLKVPFYQDRWNRRLIPRSRRVWIALKTRFGMDEPVLGAKATGGRSWQWNFAETQAEQVIRLMERAMDVGLAEAVDVDKAIGWARSSGPRENAASVKSLLSLAAICLVLLDEGIQPQDTVA